MLSEETLKKVEEIASQVATREGCELYDFEFIGGAQGRTLRVYIDKNPDGASIDDCAEVSKGLNLMLDVDDLIPGGKYNLEVSTPGVERVLKKPKHFMGAVQKKVWLRLNQPLSHFNVQNKKLQSYKQLTEVLTASDESGIEVNIEDEVIKIPYASIEKAHVVFEFDAHKGVKKTPSKLNNQNRRG